MLDATYEDLRVAYFALCDCYTDAVDELVAQARKGNHAGVVLTSIRARRLSVEAEAARAKMVGRRVKPWRH